MSEDSDTTVEYRMEDTAAVEPPAPAEASERSPEAERSPTAETPPRRRRRRRRRRRNGATSGSGATSGPPGRGPRVPPLPHPLLEVVAMENKSLKHLMCYLFIFTLQIQDNKHLL